MVVTAVDMHIAIGTTCNHGLTIGRKFDISQPFTHINKLIYKRPRFGPKELQKTISSNIS
jgi:hypothetical protein